MNSGTFKAVCYQCSFEGRVETNHCPRCSFPVILEPENTPPGGFRIEDILARDTVRSGPPLPGVDPEKRKAQLNAEARRERRITERSAQSADATALVVPANLRKYARGGTSVPSGSRWFRAVKVGLLCASAVAAGILAAALQGL